MPLTNTFATLRPKPTPGAGGDPNIHLLPSRIISDALFTDVVKDLETDPPNIQPPATTRSWIDPFESHPEAFQDEEAAELAEEEATPENFDGVDYALALAVDNQDLRSMWPDFCLKGQVFIRHIPKRPRATSKGKPLGKTTFETSQIRLWANGPVLAWCDASQPENRSSPACRIHLLQVAEMFQGSPAGEPAYAPAADERLCFSVRTQPRAYATAAGAAGGVTTLSLQAHSLEQRQQWWTVLKAVMSHLSGATAAFNSANPAAAWAAQPAPVEVLQDQLDWTDEPEFPDERGVPDALLPRGANGFAQDDVRPDAALAAADQRREVLAEVTARMNSSAAPLLSMLLSKERRQDMRRRERYLEQKAEEAEVYIEDDDKRRAANAALKLADIASAEAPTTPSHLWFEFINCFKYGVRVSSVSSELALDGLGESALYSEPSREEFTAVSVVDRFAAVGTDLRPREAEEPSVVMQELAPTVFARLRRYWAVPLSEYVLELGTSEQFVRLIQSTEEDDAELCGPAGFPAPGGAFTGAGSGRGKDRKTVWLSSTGQFWVTTLSEREARFFASWMRLYYEHMTDPRADSFLIKIVGMYHVRTPTAPSGKYIVVYRNNINTERHIHWRYELCGATPAPAASDVMAKQSTPVYLDADASEHKLEFALRPNQLRLFITQLRRDLQFLARVSAFGYHINVGVSHQDVTDKQVMDNTLAPPSSLAARFGLGSHEREFTALNEDVVHMTPAEEDRYDELLGDLPPMELYPPDITALESTWTLEGGGVNGARWDDIDEELFPDAVTYFFSISDIFSEFNSQMAWDMWWGRSEPGSEFIDPAKYAVKFASAVEARCVSEHPDFIARRKKALQKKAEAAALAAAQAEQRGTLPGVTASGTAAGFPSGGSAVGAGAGAGGVQGGVRGGFGAGTTVTAGDSAPTFNLSAQGEQSRVGTASRFTIPMDVNLDDVDDAVSNMRATAYADY